MKRPRLLKLAQHPMSPLVAEGFLSRLSFGLLSFAVPLLAYRMGVSLAAIGVLLSLNMVVAIVLKPLAGAAADRFGLKRMLVLAIVLRSAVTLLLALATAPWQLFAVRGIHGVSIAIRDPATNALIADAGGKKRIASSFAWYQTAKTLAGTIGRAVAGVMLSVTGSYRAVFLIAFALSVLPLGVVVKYVRESSLAVKLVPETKLRRVGARRPPVLPFATVGFLITGSAYLMANLFPVFATEYAGLSPAAVGAVYALGVVLAFTGPLWGWLSDRVNHHVVLSLRSVANVGSSLLYLFVPNLPGVAAGKALDDTGKAAFRPAWGALMAHVGAQDRANRTRVMAWLSVGEDSGEVAGPIVAGLIWTAWGVPALLVCRIVVAIAAEAATYLAMRRYARPTAPPSEDVVAEAQVAAAR